MFMTMQQGGFSRPVFLAVLQSAKVLFAFAAAFAHRLPTFRSWLPIAPTRGCGRKCADDKWVDLDRESS